MKSHLQAPTVLAIGTNEVRVFFASRSARQESHIGFLEIELNGREAEYRIGKVAKAPVLSPGPIGTFDEHGVFPSSVVPKGGKYYLYYIGWNRGEEPPLFYSSIGLAVSDDGVHFDRYSSAPLLARSEHDPCLVTAPYVFRDQEKWRMLYVSGIKWERDTKGKLKSFYHLKYAESCDPFNWVRSGKVAVDLGQGETNIARPTVLKLTDGNYRMWFSYLHVSIGAYRMGYAESADGYNWVRKDHLVGIGIDGGKASTMICYPCVFPLNNALYMLYNGNDYGREGFGIARWADGDWED
jgi:predicted GH43/DUF377 family glycosyl hydrolase